MTIKELKELIANVDDDVVVLVKNDCGEYDIADDGYEDTQTFWETWESYKKREEAKQRKIFCIY